MITSIEKSGDSQKFPPPPFQFRLTSPRNFRSFSIDVIPLGCCSNARELDRHVHQHHVPRRLQRQGRLHRLPAPRTCTRATSR